MKRLSTSFLPPLTLDPRTKDEPYPKEVFTVLIWGSDAKSLVHPKASTKALRVCVTGKIITYRGKPEIVANERGQIEVQK